MSLGLKIIAAAANDRPVDIKGLVESALQGRASKILSEGYKIVAAEQYGGLDEGRYRSSDDFLKKGEEPSGENRKIRKAKSKAQVNFTKTSHLIRKASRKV